MTDTPLPTSDAVSPRESGRARGLLRRWPSAVGVASAALLFLLGPDGDTLAITVVIAALCYLSAAALGRRWVAWVAVPAGGLLVTAAAFAGVPWWAVMAVAAVALVVAGLAVGAAGRAVTPQAVALVAYGGVAVVATLADPRPGLLLAGVVLALHGVWDVVHYRRDVVVSRALAEFCVLLDVPLGLACVLLALLG